MLFQVSWSAEKYEVVRVSELVFFDNGNRVVTDSLIIADKFKKRHSDVKRDIRNLDCSPQFNVSNFARIDYEDARGRKQEKFLITQDGFSFLVMGYTGKQASFYKELYIKEFNRMRNQLQPVKNSYEIDDPIERAKKWIEEREKYEAAEKKATLYEAKAHYVDDVLHSPGSITLTQIAKDYGMSAQRLNKILREAGVQYKVRDQWVLRARYQDKGYVRSQTQTINRSTGNQDTVMHTLWTQRGRAFIHQLLIRKGLVEQQLLEA